MRDLSSDIEEEDRVRRLLTAPERDLATPPFAALRARKRPLRSGILALTGAAALTLLVVLGAAVALQPGGTASPRATTPLPTSAPQSSAPGLGVGSPTACAELPAPEYLPVRSAVSQSGSRSASTDDVVTLAIQDLAVHGRPSELLLTARAAPPSEAVGEIRQAGARTVRVSYPQLSGVRLPPSYSPRIPVRSGAVASWSEPTAACPYLSAVLFSTAEDPAGLESELLKIIESMPMSPTATLPAVPLVAPEPEVWSLVRVAFASGPVAQPTWLPADADRGKVDLRVVRISPEREYEIVYQDHSGTPLVTFRLGAAETVEGETLSLCCVRGVRATLVGPPLTFGEPMPSARWQMRWLEGRRTLSITSEQGPVEDLLRIAWSLDRTTAPPGPDSSVPPRSGTCASSTSPEETVARLLSLTGSRDGNAMSDCQSRDAIANGSGEAAAWAGLPAASDVSVARHADIGDGALVLATWTFASEPGGTWEKRERRLFLMGVDEGAWRVFAILDAGTSTQ